MLQQELVSDNQAQQNGISKSVKEGPKEQRSYKPLIRRKSVMRDIMDSASKRVDVTALMQKAHTSIWDDPDWDPSSDVIESQRLIDLFDAEPASSFDMVGQLDALQTHRMHRLQNPEHDECLQDEYWVLSGMHQEAFENKLKCFDSDVVPSMDLGL